MQQLIEQMRRIAADVVNSRGVPRWGIVMSVDPVRPAVKVMWMPEGNLSGWLPIAQQAAGSGMTSVTIPEQGWQALVIPDMGHAEHGVVVGFAHSDAAPMAQVPNEIGTAPSAAKPGETVIVGPNGTCAFRITDGMIYMMGDLHVDGHIVAAKDVIAMQDVRDRNGNHGTLADLRTAYDGHHHTGVQTGGGTTSVPDRLVE